MNLDYELLCKYIGKLWIETQLKIDKLIAENDKLRLEKDQALALLSNAPGREGINNLQNMQRDS